MGIIFRARAGLGALLLVVLLAGCEGSKPPAGPVTAPTATSGDQGGGQGGDKTSAPDAAAQARVSGFLAAHWQRPLAANGAPPARYSPLEASLAPQDCGSCHPRQYADWQSALHSRAMGPGLFGQLQAMGPTAREDHQACIGCHAPLAEQAEHLVRVLKAGRAEAAQLPAGPDGASAAHGLSCAGCHVRKHQRFGPPRGDGSVPAADAGLPHGGWQVEPGYADSRFCAACHQFDADGPGLNGKPFENTYAEWQASRYAREGRHCQSCHMPGRAHLWRGIHDAPMTRSGLTIGTALDAGTKDEVMAQLSIANSGVGHAFPTYVTPHVNIVFVQRDAAGADIAGSAQRHLIARHVSLDLATEIADTRLLPDETRRYVYRAPREVHARTLHVSVQVEPDHYYAQFYRATLKDASFKTGRAALVQALKNAESSGYVLYEQSLPLDARARP